LVNYSDKKFLRVDVIRIFEYLMVGLHASAAARALMLLSRFTFFVFVLESGPHGMIEWN
jgi:hypothetical protein